MLESTGWPERSMTNSAAPASAMMTPTMPTAAADAHKDRANKNHDAHSCLGNLLAGRSAKFLNLGLKAMVSEDIGNDVSGCTLLLAARRRDAGVLQQVVEILLGIRHEGSTSSYSYM